MLANILALAGGLGLFLLGMKQMSDGIEEAAGAKLRSILEMFTKNRVLGMLVGVIFTGIIQSSSACTAMVVSFVNSGLMSLYQAAGIIFGANIGTTITSQLVSFNLSQYAPVFLLGGVLISMFVKREQIKKVGGVILGFGVLFMGIEAMKGSMSSLNESGQITEILMGLKNPLVAILTGTVITAIVQSSSVTVSIVLLMAQEGLFANVNICLFIILGCNIGACSTALIASLAGRKDAKRAALIHLLFNIIGTILMFIVLKIAMDPISNFFHSISADDGRFVANAHTIFKITQVIVLLPASSLIVKLTYLIVPGKDEKVGYTDAFQLKYIGSKALFNPTTAVVDGMKELERMASLASDNLNRAMNALITLDEDDIAGVYDTEKNIDFLNRSITNYFVKINQSTLPVEDLNDLGALFHVCNDIERIGDHAENIADLAKQRKEQKIELSDTAVKELSEMLEMVNEMLQTAIKFMLSGESMEILAKLKDIENKVDDKTKEIQTSHITRLTSKDASPESELIFADIASTLERVADHSINIAAYILHANKEGEKV